MLLCLAQKEISDSEIIQGNLVGASIISNPQRLHYYIIYGRLAMEDSQSNMQVVLVEERDGTGTGTSNDAEELPPEISVSNFDYSVENHFKAMHKMSQLSGELEFDYDESEIQRMSSSVSFLREWRHMCHRTQAITFACQGQTPQRKDIVGGVNLSQFSSAAVPVSKDISDGNASSHLRDFVMYIGGLIWALDWCPRAHQRPDSDINLEFIAIAAHHPESSYHKIGAPLTGRGVIQIWGLLNRDVKDNDMIPQFKRKSKKNSSNKATELKQTQPKRPRGRPRKNPANNSVPSMLDSTNLLHTHQISKDTHDHVAMEDTDTHVKSSAPKKPQARSKKKSLKESNDNFIPSEKHLQMVISNKNCSFTSKSSSYGVLKRPEGPSNMDRVDTETLVNVFEENTCRHQNACVGVSREQHQHTMVTEIRDIKSIKPDKPENSVMLRKKRMKDSAESFDGINHDAQPLSVVYPGTLHKFVYSGKNPLGRSKKKPLKESIDNFDPSNKHLVSGFSKGPSNMDKADLETTENVFEEDTCRYHNAHAAVSTEQQHDTMVTEIINLNSIKPDKPEKSVRIRKKRMKDSADSFDGINQDAQPLAAVLPGVLHKVVYAGKTLVETPKIVAEENSSIYQHTSQAGVEVPQQVPRGSVAEVVKLSGQQKPKKDKKKPTDGALGDQNGSIMHGEAIALNLNEEPPKVICDDEISSRAPKQVTEKDSSKKRKSCDRGYSEMPMSAASMSRLKRLNRRLILKSRKTAVDLSLKSPKCRTSPLNSGPMKSVDHKAIPVVLETSRNSCYISEDVAFPRLVMCLAHNGKVAWDVKWRPLDPRVSSKHRMGYLGALLGNGALEVWEVPLPRAAEAMFSASQKVGTDPRFVKLEPVFRCSKLKCGDKQSIPLTMEWSTSVPHDLILAGCHDGLVALWKFSANGPLKDTRPLLCFSADTVPIRALAWAPVMSDSESANIVVTAGHKGVKFWDMRDPFRPIWDLNHIQRTIYGLDWLPDPRCVALSSDDGELRIISLPKAACDVPVTGTPFAGTQLQGLNSYHCSSSSIWSLQVSRLTGMVAYCCSDGTVLHFQLTTKAVEKDPRNNREPHYLCGSMTVEGSDLTVNTPPPDIPFPMKKSSNEWSDTPRSRRGLLAVSNQEKRAREQMLKSQTPEEQPLALCYGNECASDEEHSLKTKDGSEKTYEVGEKEEFPPKIVAMHRVRWNMNKGSERWLCYGGAAGILRCQEIR